MRTLVIFLLLSASAVAAEQSSRDLLATLANGYFAKDDLHKPLEVPAQILKSAESEIARSSSVGQAVADLVSKDRTKHEAAVVTLERERAVCCLQVCLCSMPGLVLRPLTNLRDVKSIPFLIEFAEHANLCTPLNGSRGMIEYDDFLDKIAETLATLTGVTRSGDRDTVFRLDSDISRWRKWLVEHPPAGA